MVKLRRPSLLCGAVALVLGLLLTAGTADALHPALMSGVSPTGAPPSTIYGSFTGGWQEQFGPDGTLISDASFTSVGLIAGLGSGSLVFVAHIGSVQTINKFTGPYAVHLTSGITYSTATGSSIDTPCVGSFEVDQLLFSGKSAISAAVQYSMFCPGGYSYVGAEAVNMPDIAGIGYYVYTDTGALYGLGNNAYLCYQGDLSATPLQAPVVAMASAHGGGGYYMAAADGGVFTFGDATFHGSAGDLALNSPIVGMAVTPDDGGYWLVAADGGVFTYGDAHYFGSMGGHHLNAPIVGMAATPDGGGYWMVGADGGIFSFGDALYEGSTGGHPLNAPIVGMTAAPNGAGYWFVAADGGVFAFGDTRFFGSTGSLHLVSPVASMAATPDGGGYWLVGTDGGVFAFGDATFSGSTATTEAGIGTIGITHT